MKILPSILLTLALLLPSLRAQEAAEAATPAISELSAEESTGVQDGDAGLGFTPDPESFPESSLPDDAGRGGTQTDLLTAPFPMVDETFPPADFGEERFEEAAQEVPVVNEKSELRRRKIAFRKLHSKVERSDDLRALWEEAQSAESDQEKRRALRSYYDTLFERIENENSELAPLVKERRQQIFGLLKQPRTRPEQTAASETDPAE